MNSHSSVWHWRKVKRSYKWNLKLLHWQRSREISQTNTSKKAKYHEFDLRLVVFLSTCWLATYLLGESGKINLKLPFKIEKPTISKC